jgi:hypothetical protein
MVAKLVLRRGALVMCIGAWTIAVACGSDGSSGSPLVDAGSDVSGGGGSGGSGGSGGGAGTVNVDAADATVDDLCGNGLDDDGDGEVDEGCPCNEAGASQPCYGGDKALAGIGLCTMGVQYCQPVALDRYGFGTCSGWVAPVEEACNGDDDDCDGQSDEDLVHFCTEGGKTTCVSATWTPCEQCNGSDDDGDGLFDEDLLRGCTDGCSASGFQTCESMSWTACVNTRTFDPAIDHAGVIVDGVTIGSDEGVTSLSVSHATSAALAKRLLLAGVALDTPSTISSVTYAGAALTKVASWTADPGFEELRVEVFYLLDPPTGTADLTVSLAEARAINVGIYSLGNVAGAPKLLGATKNDDTQPKYTALANPKGLVVDFIAKEANHEIENSPLTELGWNFCGPGYSRFGSSIRVGDGPTNLYWTFSCCPDKWLLGAVLVNSG